MSRKGLNQVDFAVAASVVIVLFAFTTSYVSDYYSTPIEAAESAELRTDASNIWEAAFGRGSPETWHINERSHRPGLGGRIWKRSIHIEEFNNTGDSYVLNATLNVGEKNDVGKAWDGSVVVYNETGHLMNFTLEEDGYGFIDSFTIIFELKINDAEERVLDVYYSQDNATETITETRDVGLKGLDENATVNITVLSEKGYPGVYGAKAERVDSREVEDLRGMYDVGRDFRLVFEGLEDGYHGREPPQGISAQKYSKTLLYQYKNGSINPVRTSVIVW